MGSPPLARGIPKGIGNSIPRIGITPACAGNTTAAIFPTVQQRDHPRLRGEYIRSIRFIPCVPGSPPLARGIHTMTSNGSGFVGITPACAGNTDRCGTNYRYQTDHPRLRGEYSDVHITDDRVTGSPPLARGIRRWKKEKHCATRITPACAGNTFITKYCVDRLGDHPRLRGEYADHPVKTRQSEGSPPLARGILG